MRFCDIKPKNVLFRSVELNGLFIGICGGSASGKTTLCRLLLDYYRDDAQIISQDSYYHDRSGVSADEIKKINFDDPSSVDLEQLYQDLVLLRMNEPVSTPQYCFNTHSRLMSKTNIRIRKINIVEGLFIFETEKLREIFDQKIYVTADDDVRLIRRIRRDMKERGRDLDSILEQYLSSVKPMYSKHIEPKKDHADLVINTSNDHGVDEVTRMLIAKIGLV